MIAQTNDANMRLGETLFPFCHYVANKCPFIRGANLPPPAAILGVAKPLGGCKASTKEDTIWRGCGFCGGAVIRHGWAGRPRKINFQLAPRLASSCIFVYAAILLPGGLFLLH